MPKLQLYVNPRLIKDKPKKKANRMRDAVNKYHRLISEETAKKIK